MSVPARRPLRLLTGALAAAVICLALPAVAAAGPYVPPQLTSVHLTASGINSRVGGTAPMGLDVFVYGTADCTGPVIGEGTGDNFRAHQVYLDVPLPMTKLMSVASGDSTGPTPVILTGCSDQFVVGAPADPPRFSPLSPRSPSRSLSVTVSGTAPPGTDTVNVYGAAGCTGSPVASGTPAQFTAGFPVTVGADTTTTFSVRGSRGGLPSACQPRTITYVNDRTAPARPILTGTDPLTNTSRLARPKVKGIADPVTWEQIYAAPDCSGPVISTGPYSRLTSTGITTGPVPVGTTQFSATSTDRAGNVSPCSFTPIVYVRLP